MAYISIAEAWQAVAAAPRDRKLITEAYALFLDLSFIDRQLEADRNECRTKPEHVDHDCCSGHRTLKLARYELRRRSAEAQVKRSLASIHSQTWWRDQGMLFDHDAVIGP